MFVEHTKNFDDLALRACNVSKLDLSHKLHFFFQHLDRAARHIREETFLQFRQRTFERERERFFIDALENFANSDIIDQQKKPLGTKSGIPRTLLNGTSGAGEGGIGIGSDQPQGSNH